MIKDPRIGYRTHREPKVIGIARTGQVSKKGTVTHWEHWMGEQDAHVRPMSVSMKIDLRTRLAVPARVVYNEETRTWRPVRES